MLNKNYLLKAHRRLETAKFTYEKGYICSAVSNCYYALFNLMQAVVGKPPEGTWTHGGLPKAFTKTVFQKGIIPKEKIKGIVKISDRLYALRKEAEYRDTVLEYSEKAKEELPQYFLKVEELIKLLQETKDES